MHNWEIAFSKIILNYFFNYHIYIYISFLYKLNTLIFYLKRYSNKSVIRQKLKPVGNANSFLSHASYQRDCCETGEYGIRALFNRRWCVRWIHTVLDIEERKYKRLEPVGAFNLARNSKPWHTITSFLERNSKPERHESEELRKGLTYDVTLLC